MSSLLEPGAKDGMNEQTSWSLILSFVAVISVLASALPVLRIIRFLGPTFGLLAVIVGARGLQASRISDTGDQGLAIVGMASSLSCLTFSIFLSVALAQTGILGAQTTRSVQSERTYRGDVFSLTYPSSWIETNVEQPDMCQSPGIECLLTVGTKAGDGTNINVIRFALDEKATSVEADDMLWSAFKAGTPNVVLKSREVIEVDNYLGVRRVFSAPSSNTGSGRAHLLQIHLVKNDVLYQLTGWAPSADRFERYQPEMDEIFLSLRFVGPGAMRESPLWMSEWMRFSMSWVPREIQAASYGVG